MALVTPVTQLNVPPVFAGAHHRRVDGLGAVEGVPQPGRQLLLLVLRQLQGRREVLDGERLAVQERQQAVVLAVVGVPAADQPGRGQLGQSLDERPALDGVDALRLVPRGGTDDVNPARVACRADEATTASTTSRTVRSGRCR
jgi:hypothetical protein